MGRGSAGQQPWLQAKHSTYDGPPPHPMPWLLPLPSHSQHPGAVLSTDTSWISLDSGCLLKEPLGNHRGDFMVFFWAATGQGVLACSASAPSQRCCHRGEASPSPGSTGPWRAVPQHPRMLTPPHHHPISLGCSSKTL